MAGQTAQNQPEMWSRPNILVPRGVWLDDGVGRSEEEKKASEKPILHQQGKRARQEPGEVYEGRGDGHGAAGHSQLH